MNASPDEIVIPTPDDWHLHLRDGAMLRGVVPFTARAFARAIVMPNLVPPVTTADMARGYRQRIIEALPPGARFEPLMTCYLTDVTDAADLVQGHRDGIFTAAKLYPAHATTNSAAGVTDIGKIRHVLEAMQRAGIPLLVHGEVTDPSVDIFDREAVFIDRVLAPLMRDFPELRIVLEHITTSHAVEFVRDGGANLAATITPHHLMINRNVIFAGGLRPHMYCLPVAKREEHRLAIRKAATSGDPSFFLGTDSAPHPVADKETACGCAGIFNAPSALECYAQVFDEEGALDRLAAFASAHGPDFYGLKRNAGSVTLRRAPYRPPDRVAVGEGRASIVPFLSGESLAWSLVTG